MARPKALIDDAPYSRGDAVISAIGATLLIVTEMLGAVFAFAWAIGGLIGAGSTVTYALMVVFAVPGLYASLVLTRRILRVEATLRNTAQPA
jgi:membrane protein implicated in regulation of membrane protease activity